MNYPQDQLLKTMRELDPINASATDEELLSPAFNALQQRAKLNLALANVAKTFDEALTPALIAGIEAFQRFGAEVIKTNRKTKEVSITTTALSKADKESPFLNAYQKIMLAPHLAAPEGHQVRLIIKDLECYHYLTKDGLKMTHQWDGKQWQPIE